MLCKKSEKLNLTFNVSVQFKIEGAVEPELFKEALYQVVEPHESMHLTFQQEGHRVAKVVDPVPIWAMPYGYHDFSGEVAPFEKAQAVYLQSLDQPFQIFQEVAWRYDLCKIDDTTFIGILTAHHLICDFMSALTIGRSVQAAYHCLSSGIPFVNPLNGTSELQAIEESAVLEDQFFERYKEEFLLDLEGIQDLCFSELQVPLHKRNFELLSVLFDIPNATATKIGQLATEHSIAEMAIYLSALEMLIQRQTKRDRFVIGLPVNVRPGKKAMATIGYLSKPMPLSVDLGPAGSHLELIADNGVQVKKIARRRFFPMGKLYDHAIGEKLALPKINVLFNYLDTRQLSEPGCNTNVDIIPQGFTHSTMDLWLTVQKAMTGTNVKLEVSKDIFEPQQLPVLQAAYLELLNEICEQPEAPIQKKPLLEQAVDTLIAGSFTLDPLEKYLSSFQGSNGQPLVPQFLPYQQVVQTLLNLDVEAQKEVPCLSLLVRLEDFFKHGELESVSESALEEFCDAFIQAITFSVSSRKLKHQLLLCPGANTTPLFDKYSTSLLDRLKKVSGLAVEDLRSFSTAAIFNEQTNKVAHIPFETAFYQKLAFFIAKHHYQSTRPTPKVLVLDCDNTLWRGVIGEDGLKGIEITPAHQAFQKQLIASYEQGILLALSSKNNEAEVWEVFDQHPDMLLQRSHIVAHRINWEPKALSIQALQAELNLGMDAFVFIDDNPVEVGQCRAQIPELLTVQFPKEEAAIQTFADYHWAIHHTGKRSTFNRTEAYKVESQRKQVKQQFLSMEDYIAALQLQVQYEWLDASNIERASQLTLRTNQFNLTGERCTVAELQAQLDSGQRQGALLRANDKYGDYGIIGLLLFRAADRSFQVENLLLSCRVLGRGIELHLAQWVLEKALEVDAQMVHFKYKDTGRNLPGLQFLKALVQLGNWTTYGLSITSENLQKVNLGTFIRKAEVLPTT
ncbi:MAG: HAD-IIIC family phosphatase, partial [Phaeodactylibacter sp.]|nr:HAD-IIIC family phosphatase [Phaeodactylibacter sp.]